MEGSLDMTFCFTVYLLEQRFHPAEKKDTRLHPDGGRLLKLNKDVQIFQKVNIKPTKMFEQESKG